MWLALGLFLFASLATSGVVLCGWSFNAFGAGVVAMFGTGAGAVFARGVHQDSKIGHRVTAVDPSEDLFPKK